MNRPRHRIKSLGAVRVEKSLFGPSGSVSRRNDALRFVHGRRFCRNHVGEGLAQLENPPVGALPPYGIAGIREQHDKVVPDIAFCLKALQVYSMSSSFSQPKPNASPQRERVGPEAAFDGKGPAKWSEGPFIDALPDRIIRGAAGGRKKFLRPIRPAAIDQKRRKAFFLHFLRRRCPLSADCAFSRDGPAFRSAHSQRLKSGFPDSCAAECRCRPRQPSLLAFGNPPERRSRPRRAVCFR